MLDRARSDRDVLARADDAVRVAVIDALDVDLDLDPHLDPTVGVDGNVDV